LNVRERLAFNADDRAAALAAFRQRFANCEAVLLSTCNRVELYVAREVHGHPRAEEMAEFLAELRQVPTSSFRPHLYEKSDHAVVDHLFNVASSLDSMVLGETQILGQVREAYDAAREVSAAGPMLHPLFQRAIAVGKQVMHETPLAEGRLSVASVAVDYARRIFDHFDDKLVLNIGAGKMATLVLRHFAELKPKQLIIANRDPAKAAALAQRFGGQTAAFEQLDEQLASVDIVITSTGSARPIITAQRFAAVHKRRRFRPIFLIDIALPRDVEAAVGELENVYLYNLDDLQQVVSQTQAGRSGAIDAARRIVAAAVEDHARALRVREMGPVIDQLYKRYHQVAQEELARTLNKLPNVTEAERQHLEELARRIVNKLLHDPVHALRRADETHAPAEQYLHAMERLFKLTLPETPKGDDAAQAD
ncbi:MAG TPA: glutamyl-tRNA reductase, partial [Tepidisphaeraceae bacterium]|nr:glutamyl-tRNA reductase [Tepidisphaeraceae bacterium]